MSETTGYPADVMERLEGYAEKFGISIGRQRTSSVRG